MSHVVEINKSLNSTIYGSIRRGTLNFFFDIFKISFFKNTTIFIYNISPANLLSSMISKFFSCKIIYHLHDPRPHSGLLNPLIYILQFIQIILSDTIFVYNKALIVDTNRFYWAQNKSFHIVKHGVPQFNYVNTNMPKGKTKYGFFGRNMPYKNVDEFINLANKNLDSYFYILGEGYDKIFCKSPNVKIINGYIDNDQYYSTMLDVNYVVIPYRDISFSGVISDAIALDKQMIVSEKVKKLYSNSKMTLIDEFIPQNSFSSSKVSKKIGWTEYASSIIKILKI